MRIDELTGVKKYRSRTLGEWLSDFQAEGGWYDGGQFGTVVGHPSWNYVYKFFEDDDCYLDYVEWARNNPHPCVPKFLMKPKLVVPFYRRPTKEDTVWVVKIEKLYPVEWKFEAVHRVIHDSLNLWELLFDAEKEAAYRAANPPTPIRRGTEMRDDPSVQTLNRLKKINAVDPKFKELLAFVWGKLNKAKIPCHLDLHGRNIMWRADKTYVVTDPFWYGSNPWASHDRIMKVEIDYQGDHDPSMVSGGKRAKDREPYVPYMAPDWMQSDDPDDIPF